MDVSASECILKGCDVVHLQGYDRVRADCFEEFSDITAADRVSRLGLLFLSHECEIWNDSGDAAGAVVPARPDEEEQPKQAVSCRPPVIAMKAVQHEHIFVPHADERAGLVLAIGEFSLLEVVEFDTSRPRDGICQDVRSMKCEETHGEAFHLG